MSFSELLKVKVKPELNHIYTEKPRYVHGGNDVGWFCREHAIHLFALARLAKLASSICLGDFIIRTAEVAPISSISDDSDHAWCAIDGITPVDLSITLKYLSPTSPDVPMVYGSNSSLSSPYTILHFQNIDDKVIIDACSKLQRVIAYRQREVLDFDPVELLNHPFEFLFPPPPGYPTLTETFGDDFFFRITYHCYKLLFENSKPFFQLSRSSKYFKDYYFS
ncbi:MAG: hypothetical protein A3J81_02155 [Nitrospirae bacterium RIFOXYB2_FULL_43_5]|nr:MAG: hypothetical protein A2X54_00630 [Nitrospirae bacterium GWF2_44_13]OGW34709.1 MAG: hypothetical protein A2088_03765 [Nitrospirae bacterium GWD2_44_7]OGW63242.1 MAG: hypothetical protein A2222_07170 [Nitrospirae bacterium RIFOXYA2_FULL_44_9]OGW74373.1 MAG: hypothetical protein A3J81_02155 [Nitrospirae bacterium RIFOXYB2_FULL_43_5]HBG92653.1 hypothetical protein [Nitrospiraceae bacterium]